MKKKQLVVLPGQQHYGRLLQEIKIDIQNARIRTYISANRGLIELYWNIGLRIVQRQEQFGWGKAVVEKLSRDLCKAFPGNKSFSTRNLWFMRQMYYEYRSMTAILKQPVSELKKLKQLVSDIPWGQNILILQKISALKARMYYLGAVKQMGWSRNVLLNQIKANAYKRHSTNKQHNFMRALPAHLAEQADKAMKDVYMLDFLGVAKPIREREIENRMIEKIRDVLLEFGHGFTFVGSQYHIEFNHKDYYIDLLFYQRKLRCLVAVELKAGEFKPEYAGKMNFYLNILDELEKQEGENPAIGIILCAERDRIDVEFALRGATKPIGVAEYVLTKKLPAHYKNMFPDPAVLNQRVRAEILATNTMPVKQLHS